MYNLELEPLDPIPSWFKRILIDSNNNIFQPNPR